MYRIFADDTLIYDSTLDDYKIGKGAVTLEIGKAGSFVFSLYPDHFFYDRFVPLRTVVTVYKDGRIVFRGRVLDDTVDYWNNKVLTCEGELGFLQDSVVRPYSFQGTPAALFAQYINGHNAQVDEFKRFKVGAVDIQDGNDYINRSSTDYSSTQAMLGSALTGSALGGYLYITHGDDGTDPVPTIHYVKDFPKVAPQAIEFGVNLKEYTRTAKAEELATAIIPLGAQTDNDGGRLTIEDANGGVDYVYSETAVALYGWVFKTVVWDDVTLANNLKRKAEAYLESAVDQAITIELTAIDLHLLDRTIESYNVCEYVRATSKPHGFDATLLCNKQTMDLLNPENDTVTLGYQTQSFTGATTQMAASVSTLGKQVSSISQDATSIKLTVGEQGKQYSELALTVDGLTVTDESGTTRIKGSSIETDTLHVNAANIDGTLTADQVTLTGSIRWDDLDSDVQDNINSAGGISESEAKTLITKQLVSSPNIAGGKFWDLDQEAYITMDADYGAGHRYAFLEFHHGSNRVFYVESDNTLSDFDPDQGGSVRVKLSTLAGPLLIAEYTDYVEGTSSAIKPQGEWDFEDATVTGLVPTWG